MKLLTSARSLAGNLFFPPQCGLCGELTDRAGGICGLCWQNLNFIADPACTRCGYPLPYAMGDQPVECAHCLAYPPIYHAHRSPLVFDDHSKRLVHDLKYYDKTLMLRTLAGWMAQAGQSWLIPEDRPLLVPIPLHRYRLWRRKYNQAGLLAGSLSQLTGVEVAYNALKRIKYRPPQAGLSRRQRLINLRGAFALNTKWQDEIKTRPVILVDDVLTTGSTLNACAKLLIKAGCPRVYALTIATTVLES